MNTLDMTFILLPLAVFMVHVIWGPKMKTFGYDDGIGFSVIVVGFIYILGLTFIQNEFRSTGYPFMILSFTVRPTIHHLTQYIARRYVKRHTHKDAPELE